MQAVDRDDESFIDPDDIKMPESPEHRRVTDLIAAATERLLPSIAVYRDMNWYPRDAGHAVAPDVMTLPEGTLPSRAKSYQQPADGPVPGVVVEVLSESDTFENFHAKTGRYRRLGVVVYAVFVQPESVDVLRLSDTGYTRWIDRPVSELGDLRIDIYEGSIVVVMPDGARLHKAGDLVTITEMRAVRAEQRAAALEAQLRSLGIDPAPD
jgi:Uma2 family endonuclease